MKLTTLAFSLSTVAIATAGIEIGNNQNIKGDVHASPGENIKIGESNGAAGTAASNTAKIDEAIVSGDKPPGSSLGAAGDIGAPAGSALGAAPAGSALGAAPAGSALGAAGDVGAPAGSALGAAPAGSALGAAPAGSALGAAPAGSALGAAPAGSALGAADDALLLGDGASKDAPKEEPKDANKAGPAAAGTQEVALVVKDASGAKVEGTLELQKMEGGASVIYVKKEGEARKFDLKDGVASVKAEGDVSVVGKVEAHGGAAVLAAGKSDAHAVTEQKLEFNAQGKVTNLQFYVSAQFTVGISLNGLIPEDCKPIEIYKQASPNAKAPVSAGAPGNSSMSTVTDWVTYCPEATTITMTTCVQETCKPTAITVTGETTVTITGECLVEATAAVAAKASGGVAGPINRNAGDKGGDSSPAKGGDSSPAKGGDSSPAKGGDAGKAAPASKTPAPASAAPKASVASAPKASAPAAAAGAKTNQTALVSAFNGAAKNAAGVVGAVGVLAFLM